ncbi:MAG TPA: TonB-dependent receptor [Porticoccaceae bacterium]|nr:TonB-dependent receptor [Porticoccaceae bacterium]
MKNPPVIKTLYMAVVVSVVAMWSITTLGADEVPAAVSTISEDEIAATPKARGTAALLMEEVVTTSRKKSTAEEVQDVPIAMTAYSGEQLEALQVRNLEEMSFSMPNVQLDSVGTTRGTANFSIRGQGINSSIPSVDPTVGVFIDGMYLGMSHGALYDMFDLEGMEVLRGPQGVLFGRNVTGGAVTMRTTRPSHDFTFKAKASVTDDNDQVYGLVTTGSLIPDVLSGKLALYGRDDEGYFEDVATGNDNFGEAETYIIRPAVTWTISEDLETTLIYERGEDRGDQAIPYNSLNPVGDFKVATHVNPDSEEIGQFNNARWMHLISETTYDVDFGNGTFTNITAYRKVNEESDGDLDGGTDIPDVGAPNVFEFHTGAKIDQEQFSEELRYAGTFLDDRLALTVGGYFFTQNISMAGHRDLSSIPIGGSKTPRFTYGGELEHETWGVFVNGDYQLYDNLTMSLGIRYTDEEKDVEAAGAFVSSPGDLPGLPVSIGCLFEPQIKCGPDFIDAESWSNVTPRVAFQYYFNDTSHLYFSWAKGFRSGGYNMRLTSPTQRPGPWDEESQNTWELGMKSEWNDGRVRFNVAMFLNQVEDMIREVIFNDPDNPGNAVQSIRNTADADIRGIEMDINWLATDNLLLFMNVGYLDGEYKEVGDDLNRDGVVNGDDKQLVLPRLSRWTGSVGANYDIPIDAGLISTRIGYSHRTAGFFSDSNVDDLSSHDELTAGISFMTNDGKWKASLFGKNLLDQVQRVTQFTIIPGATSFAPIKKGRVVGVELEYQY